MALVLSTALAIAAALASLVAVRVLFALLRGLPWPRGLAGSAEMRTPMLSAAVTLVGFTGTLVLAMRALASISSPMRRHVWLAAVTFCLACVWLLASRWIHRVVRRAGGLFRLVAGCLAVVLLVTWWLSGLLLIRFALSGVLMLLVGLAAHFRHGWRIWRIRAAVVAVLAVAVGSLPWAASEAAFEMVYLSKSLPSHLLRVLPPHNRGDVFRRIRAALDVRLAHPPVPREPRDSGPPTVAGERPDIVLVTIDALRADRVGSGRNGVSLTPNLDRLARASVDFRRAFAPAPETIGSMSQIMTGLPWTQIPHLPAPYGAIAAISPGTETLSARLGESGYLTFAVLPERLVLYYPSLVLGFGRVLKRGRDPQPYLDTAGLFTRVIEVLGPTRSRPVFIWAHVLETHGHANREGVDVSAYEAAVGRADRELGRLLEHLDRQRGRNTVLIVTADHGESLGEGGVVWHGTARASVLAVPLVIRVPGVTPRVVWNVVGTHDLHTTVLARAGLAADAPAGRDLLAISAGAPERERIVHHAMVGFTTPEQVYELGATRYPWQLVYYVRADVRVLRNLERDPLGVVNLAGRGLAVESELLETIAARLTGSE